MRGFIPSIFTLITPECTCTGFRFRLYCKHIKAAAEKRCSWHEAFDERMTEEGKCPRCGKEVSYVRMGV